MVASVTRYVLSTNRGMTAYSNIGVEGGQGPLNRAPSFSLVDSSKCKGLSLVDRLVGSIFKACNRDSVIVRTVLV